MELITTIVSLFLVFIVLAIMYSFVLLWNENKDLTVKNTELQQTLTTTESKNTELQTKLDNLMKQPSMLGLSYKTDSAELQKVSENLKQILQEIQTASCPIIRNQFLLHRQQFIDSLTTGLQKNPVKCETIKQTFDTQTSVFATAMTAAIIKEIPTARADILKTQFKTLVETILVIMCSGDKLEVAKVDQFLIDILNALCYNA